MCALKVGAENYFHSVIDFNRKKIFKVLPSRVLSLSHTATKMMIHTMTMVTNIAPTPKYKDIAAKANILQKY